MTELQKKEAAFFKKREALANKLEKARDAHDSLRIKHDVAFDKVQALETELTALYFETIKELELLITPTQG